MCSFLECEDVPGTWVNAEHVRFMSRHLKEENFRIVCPLNIACILYVN